ncbi:follicle cell protein 3C-1 isoform X2 [Cylas formicarius]|uniref:follicle cell protein 3C-1 isoform X2 n=1 Tax=Cylas formicarius TaxID=197179 RepID=UPI002958478E|nr:follicle cell protein 3C-1 isoform X2 [Cylas formicarius]
MWHFLFLASTLIVFPTNITATDNAKEGDFKTVTAPPSEETPPPGPVPCTCAVFLSSQFKKGSKDQPKGSPVLMQEIDTPFMANALGNKQCTHRCLEVIIKHLPKSNEIICATVDKDHVHREKAYLFVKNHSDKWHETKLSAGREFCCKDNLPYKCFKPLK